MAFLKPQDQLPKPPPLLRLSFPPTRKLISDCSSLNYKKQAADLAKVELSLENQGGRRNLGGKSKTLCGGEGVEFQTLHVNCMCCLCVHTCTHIQTQRQRDYAQLKEVGETLDQTAFGSKTCLRTLQQRLCIRWLGNCR